MFRRKRNNKGLEALATVSATMKSQNRRYWPDETFLTPEGTTVRYAAFMVSITNTTLTGA